MKTDWEEITLGELCELITKGTTPTSVGYKFVEDGINFIKIESIDSSQNFLPNKFAAIGEDCHQALKRSQLKSGDILFSIAGALGRTAVVTSEILPANTNQALAIIRLKVSENILIDYILLTLSSGMVVNQVNKLKGGAAQQNLSLEQVRGFKIPLPPLPEQQRIVAILDEAFAAIDQAKANAQRNLQNARELFDSYLQSVFANPGEGWEEKTLGQIAEFRNGLNFTKSSKGETIKIVGVKDFQKNYWIPFDNLESVTIAGALSVVDYLKEGDILAVRSNGNQELIGRSILAGPVKEKTSHSGFTIRVRLTQKDVFSPYLCHYLKTQGTRRQLTASGSGTNIKSLNQGALSSLSISLPPFKEQQVIVDKIEAMIAETKKLESIYQQKLTDLDELKKSILQKAFRGELSTAPANALTV